MARMQAKKLKVDDAPGVSEWEWYRRDAGTDVTGWLASIDAGQEQPFQTTDVPEAAVPEVDGDYDFAVVQSDPSGNRSDPAIFAAWTAVPLDTTPPAAATGGVIVDA